MELNLFWDLKDQGKAWKNSFLQNSFSQLSIYITVKNITLRPKPHWLLLMEFIDLLSSECSVCQTWGKQMHTIWSLFAYYQDKAISPAKWQSAHSWTHHYLLLVSNHWKTLSFFAMSKHKTTKHLKTEKALWIQAISHKCPRSPFSFLKPLWLG